MLVWNVDNDGKASYSGNHDYGPHEEFSPGDILVGVNIGEPENGFGSLLGFLLSDPKADTEPQKPRPFGAARLGLIRTLAPSRRGRRSPSAHSLSRTFLAHPLK